MATYSYVAKDALGKVVTGTSEAENQQILVRRLREKGYFVQKVSSSRAAPRPTTQRAPASKFVIGRVTGRDLSIFCRQFATMIDAGVSLVRCLAVLEEQSTSAKLRQIIRELQQSVEAGETLSRVESARGEMAFYLVADGTAKAWRVRTRTGSFTAMGIIEAISPGLMVADLVALIASLDVVAPEIDR